MLPGTRKGRLFLDGFICFFLLKGLPSPLLDLNSVVFSGFPWYVLCLGKKCWVRELYLGLKVTASFDRSESYTRVIDG